MSVKEIEFDLNESSMFVDQVEEHVIFNFYVFLLAKIGRLGREKPLKRPCDAQWESAYRTELFPL